MRCKIVEAAMEAPPDIMGGNIMPSLLHTLTDSSDCNPATRKPEIMKVYPVAMLSGIREKMGIGLPPRVDSKRQR